MLKLNAAQLRNLQSSAINAQTKRLSKKKQIYIVLDNVLDTYNIGSVFRLADAVGAQKVILCGGSATPPNPRIKKASINTTEIVDWEYRDSALQAIQQLKTVVKELQVVAIEQSPQAVAYNQFDYVEPVCFVVGHESNGVSPEVLKIADAIVEIPMFGINISLNVMVSLAIVLYQAIAVIDKQLPKD
ncbi:hypothetical protein M1563_00470 [Patescibacteria group bacterium]|nr:hypothetical protein [Patescibacteria group bacterium]